MSRAFFYGKDKLTVQTAVSLAGGELPGILNPEIKEKIKTSQHHVKAMVNAGKTVYGVTTWFRHPCQYKNQLKKMPLHFNTRSYKVIALE
jgi:histidine ammonia-lyase